MLPVVDGAVLRFPGVIVLDEEGYGRVGSVQRRNGMGYEGEKMTSFGRQDRDGDRNRKKDTYWGDSRQSSCALEQSQGCASAK